MHCTGEDGGVRKGLVTNIFVLCIAYKVANNFYILTVAAIWSLPERRFRILNISCSFGTLQDKFVGHGQDAARDAIRLFCYSRIFPLSVIVITAKSCLLLFHDLHKTGEVRSKRYIYRNLLTAVTHYGRFDFRLVLNTSEGNLLQ
jgi:hypothetical protein